MTRVKSCAYPGVGPTAPEQDAIHEVLLPQEEPHPSQVDGHCLPNNPKSVGLREAYVLLILPESALVSPHLLHWCNTLLPANVAGRLALGLPPLGPRDTLSLHWLWVRPLPFSAHLILWSPSPSVSYWNTKDCPNCQYVGPKCTGLQ